MAPSSIKLLPVALLASIAHAGTNHVVTVGKGSNLAFDPPTLNAAVGDTVTYQFFSKVGETYQMGPSSEEEREARWAL